MDSISDSDSEDAGSIPAGITYFKSKAINILLMAFLLPTGQHRFLFPEKMHDFKNQ
jgi:hypothetical protein